MNFKRATAALTALGLAGLIGLFAFPLFWMSSYSLRPVGQPPPARLELFPWPLTLDNYAGLGRYLPVGQYLWNSLQLVALAVPLTLVTASWAGFAMRQAAPRRRRALLLLSLLALLVPAPAVWVPRFIAFAHLGWTDTYLPLLAPAVMGTSPFFVLVFYLAFARVPLDLYDSARLDGANPWQVWFWVALPLCRPAVIAVSVLAFAAYWGNSADPLLYLHTEAKYTLPLGVQLLQQARQSYYPVLMAASLILAAPLIILFGWAQRYFLRGEITLN